jgi:hypothetical protein
MSTQFIHISNHIEIPWIHYLCQLNILNENSFPSEKFTQLEVNKINPIEAETCYVRVFEEHFRLIKLSLFKCILTTFYNLVYSLYCALDQYTKSCYIAWNRNYKYILKNYLKHI